MMSAGLLLTTVVSAIRVSLEAIIIAHRCQKSVEVKAKIEQLT